MADETPPAPSPADRLDALQAWRARMEKRLIAVRRELSALSAGGLAKTRDAYRLVNEGAAPGAAAEAARHQALLDAAQSALLPLFHLNLQDKEKADG